MIKYINDKIKINRPIVFLCGPYYDKNNPSDRRRIMLEFFKEKFGKSLISLIIDDFLTDEKISDPTINVKILEEIFASVSPMTYLFLDSLSAATELGLFANHTTNNKINVFLPYESDILQNKVGYFVKSIVIEQNSDRVSLDYYRPKIIKVAKATDFAVEHYGFVNNEIPKEIYEKLLDEEALSSIEANLVINELAEMPSKNIGTINYEIDNNHLKIRISIITLFYIISDCIYENFEKNDIKNVKLEKVTKGNIDKLYSDTVEVLVNTIEIYTGKNIKYEKITISTLIKSNFKQIVKHIFKFIVLYHENKPRLGLQFITNSDSFIRKAESKKKLPSYIFRLDRYDKDLIDDMNLNPGKYFEEFKHRKYGKIKKMIKYKSDENGILARDIHNKIAVTIREFLEYSFHSFAYQKRKSVIDCVSQHLGSNHFVKIDIRKFFNNIDGSNLEKVLKEKLMLTDEFVEELASILKVCQFNNEIPIGFITSPVLSELYMEGFDSAIAEFLRDKEMIYTRYADDILISSSYKMNKETVNDIYSILGSLLEEKSLQINKKKFRVGYINRIGDHFKYLGLNIVYQEPFNVLTVGRKYKYDIAKRYLNYWSIEENTEENIKRKFYESRRIAGQVSFVKQVEGMNGYKDIVNRIRISSKGRMNIKTDILPFK